MVRAPTDPVLPDQATVDGHNLLHVKFEPWCEHCVSGRAIDGPHMSTEKKTEELKSKTKDVIQCDYMYLVHENTDGTVEKKKSVPCAVDGEGEGIATEVYTKGRRGEYARKELEAVLKETGRLGGCILQHDPEDAVADVVKMIIK